MLTNNVVFATFGSRPNNILRNAIAAFLFAFSPNCVVCNKETEMGLSSKCHNAFQIGHIIPGGTKRLGWFAGNLATMCRECNEYIGDRDCTPFIPLFKNAAGIPAIWPANNALIAEFGNVANNGSGESTTICKEIFG